MGVHIFFLSLASFTFLITYLPCFLSDYCDRFLNIAPLQTLPTVEYVIKTISYRRALRYSAFNWNVVASLRPTGSIVAPGTRSHYGKNPTRNKRPTGCALRYHKNKPKSNVYQQIFAIMLAFGFYKRAASSSICLFVPRRNPDYPTAPPLTHVFGWRCDCNCCIGDERVINICLTLYIYEKKKWK